MPGSYQISQFGTHAKSIYYANRLWVNDRPKEKMRLGVSHNKALVHSNRLRRGYSALWRLLWRLLWRREAMYTLLVAHDVTLHVQSGSLPG